MKQTYFHNTRKAHDLIDTLLHFVSPVPQQRRYLQLKIVRFTLYCRTYLQEQFVQQSSLDTAILFFSNVSVQKPSSGSTNENCIELYFLNCTARMVVPEMTCLMEVFGPKCCRPPSNNTLLYVGFIHFEQSASGTTLQKHTEQNQVYKGVKYVVHQVTQWNSHSSMYWTFSTSTWHDNLISIEQHVIAIKLVHHAHYY